MTIIADMLEKMRTPRPPGNPASAQLTQEQKLGLLLTSAAMMEAEAEHSAAIAEDRAAIARELEEISTTATTETVGFNEFVSQSVTVLTRLRKEFRDTETRHIVRCNERGASIAALERRRETAEKALRQTAHPALAEAKDRLWDVLRDRHAQPVGPAGDAWRAGVRRAIESIEAAQLLPDQSDIPGRLTAILNLIPANPKTAPAETPPQTYKTARPGR